MFGSIAKIIRISAFVGVLGAIAFLGFEYIKTRDSAHVVNTVKTTAEASARLASDKGSEARRAWQKFDLDRKVGDLQDKTRPVGRKITQVVGPKLSPSLQAVEKGERRMSLPALILIFVFGSIFVLMGKFSANGGRY